MGDCKQSRDIDKKIEACRKLGSDETARRQFVRGLNMRGSVALYRGDYTAALEDYQALAKLTPGNAGTHTNLGEAALRLGRAKLALRAFEKALSLGGRSFAARLGRAKALHQTENFSGAAQDYSLALTLNPKATYILALRGNARLRAGDNPGALKDFNRAIALQSKNARHFGGRALVHAMAKRFNPALADIDQAIALNPRRAGFLYRRGLILAALDRTDDARKAYRAALDLEPGLLEAQQALARLDAPKAAPPPAVKPTPGSKGNRATATPKPSMTDPAPPAKPDRPRPPVPIPPAAKSRTAGKGDKARAPASPSKPDRPEPAPAKSWSCRVFGLICPKSE
jgi:tetratricopeptide (TPR) repeat protein